MKALLLAAATAVAAFSAAGPAIPAGPFVVRTVTMDGMQGPAYYSVVDKRFHFVTPARPASEREVAALSRTNG